jgi:hypothetical protein
MKQLRGVLLWVAIIGRSGERDLISKAVLYQMFSLHEYIQKLE